LGARFTRGWSLVRSCVACWSLVRSFVAVGAAAAAYIYDVRKPTSSEVVKVGTKQLAAIKS